MALVDGSARACGDVAVCLAAQDVVLWLCRLREFVTRAWFLIERIARFGEDVVGFAADTALREIAVERLPVVARHLSAVERTLAAGGVECLA